MDEYVFEFTPVDYGDQNDLYEKIQNIEPI